MDLDAKRLSLTLALFDPSNPNENAIINKYKGWQDTARRKIFDGKNPPTTQEAFQGRKDDKEKVKKKLMRIQKSIYQNLYSIIEYYEDAHNDTFNNAIGKALAIVIANHSMIGDINKYPQADHAEIQDGINRFNDEIPRLRTMLRAVVTQAIDDAEKAESSENADADEMKEAKRRGLIK